jgi:hypothetical protein
LNTYRLGSLSDLLTILTDFPRSSIGGESRGSPVVGRLNCPLGHTRAQEHKSPTTDSGAWSLCPWLGCAWLLGMSRFWPRNVPGGRSHGFCGLRPPSALIGPFGRLHWAAPCSA